MITNDLSKIEKIIKIFDNFRLDLKELQDDHFALSKQKDEDKVQGEIDEVRQKIQGL